MEHLFGILDAITYVIRQVGSNVLAVAVVISIAWMTPRIVKIVRTTKTAKG